MKNKRLRRDELSFRLRPLIFTAKLNAALVGFYVTFSKDRGNQQEQQHKNTKQMFSSAGNN